MRTSSAPRDERGVTVIEMVVAMGVLLIFGAVAFSGLFGVNRATKSTQDKSQTLTEARQALETILRDLRAANPIDYRNVAAEYNTQVSFTVSCDTPGVGSCPANGQRAIAYRVVNFGIDRAVNGTWRTLLRPAAPSATARGAVVNAATQPVFTYRSASGTVINPAVAGGTTFRDCTETVDVVLRVIDRAGNTTRPVVLSGRVTLRNYHEVSGC